MSSDRKVILQTNPGCRITSSAAASLLHSLLFGTLLPLHMEVCTSVLLPNELWIIYEYIIVLMINLFILIWMFHNETIVFTEYDR